MYLQRIRVVNFKNYEDQEVEWSAQLNGLTGHNGMGKTNLLEAIYYLCMCKSCRGLSDQKLPRKSSDWFGFRLEGTFVIDGEEQQVIAKVEPRKRKQFEWNGLGYERLADHIGRLPVVTVFPDDVQLIQEGSEARRRFFDNTLCQLDADYLQDLMHYQKTLKQRNAALKEMAERGRSDHTLLDTYDALLQEPAGRIHQKRVEWTSFLQPHFQSFYQQISGEAEQVSILYQADLSETDWPDLMRSHREKDLVLHRSTAGPHKDDWQFRIHDWELKRYGSQGQLKSFLLALKLGQYRALYQQKERPPLLLVDDLFDKLDAQRARQLLELLQSQAFGQVFLTDTERQRLEQVTSSLGVECKLFEVQSGQVHLI